jgi:hypothetical protein
MEIIEKLTSFGLRIRVEGLLRTPSLRQDEGGETLGPGGRAAEQGLQHDSGALGEGSGRDHYLNPLEVRAKPFVRLANGYMNDRKCSLYEIQEKIDNYRKVTKNKPIKVLI